MSNTKNQGSTLPLPKVREICRCILMKKGERATAAQVGCSPATVHSTKERMAAAGCCSSIEELDALSDATLCEQLYGKGRSSVNGNRISVLRPSRRSVSANKGSVLSPDYDALACELEERLCKKKTLWAEYQQKCMDCGEDSVCRTTFFRCLGAAVKKLCKESEAFMSQQRVYGFEVQIDYCGTACSVLFPDGHVEKLPVGVLVWAASNLVYAEILPAMTTDATCAFIGHMVSRRGVVPEILVCDNAKSMVVSHQVGHEAIFVQKYQHFLSQLGITAVAALPYQPRDKSQAEESVKLVQDRCLSELNREKPLTLEEANRRLIALVDERINKAGFRKGGTGTPRAELFERYELPVSRRFSGTVPEICDFIPHMRVPRDYHVTINGDRYMVPYTLLGHYVCAEVTPSRVRILCDGKTVASFRPGYGDDPAATKGFMPESHDAWAEKNRRYHSVAAIQRECDAVSPLLGQYCRRFFSSSRHSVYDRDGVLHVLNKYRNPQYSHEELDSALRAVLQLPADEITSLRFDKELGLAEAHRYAEAAGTVAYTGSDSSDGVCLRGSSLFSGRDSDGNENNDDDHHSDDGKENE